MFCVGVLGAVVFVACGGAGFDCRVAGQEESRKEWKKEWKREEW